MPADREMTELLEKVPEARRARFEQIATLIDEFCAEHLHEGYRAIMRGLAAHVCQVEPGVIRGKPGSWASGIARIVIGVNLFDDLYTLAPLTLGHLSTAFGVSESTVSAKSGTIRKMLMHDDDAVELLATRPRSFDEKDAPWLIDVGGMVLDFREAPREIQAEAFRRGMIPYIWCDRHASRGGMQPAEVADRESDILARIGPDGITPVSTTATPPPAQLRPTDLPPDLDEQLAPLASSFMDSLLSGAIMGGAVHAPKPQACRPQGRVYVLRITLLGCKPPIWRRVAVRDDTTLAHLHYVVQAVMGWHNRHPHLFQHRDSAVQFTTPEIDDLFPPDVLDESEYTVCDLFDREKSRALYQYDFGNNWKHRIELQKIVDPDPDARYPACLAGKRACPPETCGGVYHYASLLRWRAAAEDTEDDFGKILPAGFDPEYFSLEDANQRLRSLSLLQR